RIAMPNVVCRSDLRIAMPYVACRSDLRIAMPYVACRSDLQVAIPHSEIDNARDNRPINRTSGSILVIFLVRGDMP
ncbi:MAG: hypothetical protein OXN17_00780, partial [Candidatus Poribacteria bacterium]|nr:hypothetical protein [Candidatus Poribacteria bacterium]